MGRRGLIHRGADSGLTGRGGTPLNRRGQERDRGGTKEGQTQSKVCPFVPFSGGTGTNGTM